MIQSDKARLPPPNLIVSRKDAERKINAQLERGYELAKNTLIVELRESTEVSKWSDFNIELLQRIFDNSSIADEYEAEYGRIVRSYLSKYILERGIAHLESVLYRLELIPELSQPENPQHNAASDKAVFIVHGHDESAKESTARFIEKLGLQAIVLHEQANAGRTIIEKFEDHSNVGFAIVLLTPDDFGALRNSHDLKPRARQNVILELGYFMGKLGRGRVCALYKEGVEIPSDYQGVLYIPMDSAGAWKMQLAREIRSAGIEVDLNKVM